MLEKYVESKRKTFIIKRTIKVLPVILLATIIAFGLMRVGDPNPGRRILGDQATEEQVMEFNKEHGLHHPRHIQYINWMSGLPRGELGTSIRYGDPVGELIAARIPITLQMMGLSLLISAGLGVSVGVIGALNHNTWIDYLCTIEALFWWSAPSFWVGLIFLLFFGYELGWFPVGGYGGSIYYLILPATVLGIRLQAVIARLTRSSMLSVLRKDYINTAKTKGLKGRVVVVKHALRNALIPVITIIALRLPWLFGGAMITEQIFNIPGMGRFIFTTAIARDMIAVQSTVLLIVVLVVLANLGADIAYTFVDPRIDLAESGGA